MGTELKAARDAAQKFENAIAQNVDDAVLLKLALDVQDAIEAYVASHVS